jgi:tetratricopeptide (TPR) repeat protein
MQPAEPGAVLGNFEGARFEHDGRPSRFFRRDGGFYVRTEGADGRLGEYEIAYVFGVYPLQQYLVRRPGGRLQALGIAWDARPAANGGQRWFHLYPDAAPAPGDPLHWTGRDQTWNFMCAECHSTALEKNYDPASDGYDTRWSEIDVACEACHGPGSEHVRRAEDAARGGGDPTAAGQGLTLSLGRTDAWRLEPGDVTARRDAPAARTEVETCARCHSRRGVLTDEYEHGRPLLDSHRPALLDAGLYHADGQILDEVYVYGSFLQSRMYAAGVSCSDCHDAHALTLRAEGNALCGGCHRPDHFDAPAHHHHAVGSEAARCVACHMPSRRYMGVDDRRDHSLRVPRPDLSARLGTPDPCSGCHTGRSPDWAAGWLDEWYGSTWRERPQFAEALDAGRRGLPDAEERLAALATDGSYPGIARATALRLLRDELGPASLEAVRQGLRDADALVRMAALEASEALPPELRLRLARPLLRDPVRGVRIQAVSSLLAVPPDLWSARGRSELAEAVADYRGAQAANADRPEAHLNLAGLYTSYAELDRARAEYERAILLDASFVPAYVNLADLERRAGRDDASERALRRGLEAVPDAPDLQHALGLALVRSGRRGEALRALERAHTLAPERARYAYVYAVGLASEGRLDAAIQVLERAHDRRPGDRHVLRALADYHRQRGDRDRARAYARKLAERSPADPAVADLLRELETAPRRSSATR